MKLQDLCCPKYVGFRKDALTKVASSSEINWFAQLDATGWFGHLFQVLKGAVRVVDVLERRACSVLIHCSDGWDRTSQLSALAMLLLDPHYRTIKGFEVC